VTTSKIDFMHCDFARCTAQTPYDSRALHIPVRADGWTNAICTHGCPEHGEAIRAHQASITSQTRGRGRSEKTTWFLACACGWRPAQPWQTHSTDYLRQAHLDHVRTITEVMGATA
jgi:hypothetical protein